MAGRKIELPLNTSIVIGKGDDSPGSQILDYHSQITSRLKFSNLTEIHPGLKFSQALGFINRTKDKTIVSGLLITNVDDDGHTHIVPRIKKI